MYAICESEVRCIRAEAILDVFVIYKSGNSLQIYLPAGITRATPTTTPFYLSSS